MEFFQMRRLLNFFVKRFLKPVQLLKEWYMLYYKFLNHSTSPSFKSQDVYNKFLAEYVIV